MFIEGSKIIFCKKNIILTLAYVAASILAFFSGYAFSMNDPMQPPEYSVSSGVIEEMMDGELDLQMILISPARKFAVLNNKTVKEGGEVSGVKIISIEKERVVVKRKGKIFDLRLGPAKNREGVER
ncbi:hypothetical protein A9Q81_02405 [Gammaproteobacteria bacterium 42_54_T18]|nr:hypothetical protein A9Q81_02405 [Gammaproteobacteria bacterium 42_54_T18]